MEFYVNVARSPRRRLGHLSCADKTMYALEPVNRTDVAHDHRERPETREGVTLSKRGYIHSYKSVPVSNVHQANQKPNCTVHPAPSEG